MQQLHSDLKLEFIESFLRDGTDSEIYDSLREQLYQIGCSSLEVINLLVEGQLYGTLDNFYNKYPHIKAQTPILNFVA